MRKLNLIFIVPTPSLYRIPKVDHPYLYNISRPGTRIQDPYLPLSPLTRGYSAIWSLLGYPSAVFLLTTVNPEKDNKDQGHLPETADDKFVYGLVQARGIQERTYGLIDCRSQTP